MKDLIGNENLEQIRIQRDFALGLSSITDFDELMTFCLDSAINIGFMDSGGIYFIDSSQHSFNLICHKGLSEDFIKIRC